MRLNTFLGSNLEKYNMQVLRKILIVCFAFFATQLLEAQSNPGYLGRKNLIQLDVNGLMGNAIFEGPLMKVNYGISYEMAKNEDFAWNFGYSSTSQTMDFPMINYESLTLSGNNGGNYEYFYPQAGTIDYTFNEFKITPKWYNSGKGGIAPYGISNSLEFSLGFLNIDPNITKWASDRIDPAMKEVKKIPSATVFSISYFFGGRRMLSDQVGLEYNMGFGYTFYQSVEGNLLDREDFTDIVPYYQYTALKHVSSAKLFQAKIGLCYLL